MLVAREDRALILGTVRVVDAPWRALVTVDAAKPRQASARAIVCVACTVAVAWVGITQVVDALALLVTREALCARAARPTAAIAPATSPIAIGLAAALLDNIRAARPEQIAAGFTGAAARGDASAVILAGGIRGGSAAASGLANLAIRAEPALAAAAIGTARLPIAFGLAL